MSPSAQMPVASGGPMRWLSGALAWLDQRGKFAWIAAMVFGFIAICPSASPSLPT